MAAQGQEPPPVPASSVLMSASKLISSECGGVSKAYIACKRKDPNPEACLGEGDVVTSCVIDLLKDLNQRCPGELKAYYECMDYYSNDFQKCRKQQQAFEEVAFVARKDSKK